MKLWIHNLIHKIIHFTQFFWKGINVNKLLPQMVFSPKHPTGSLKTLLSRIRLIVSRSLHI